MANCRYGCTTARCSLLAKHGIVSRPRLQGFFFIALLVTAGDPARNLGECIESASVSHPDATARIRPSSAKHRTRQLLEYDDRSGRANAGTERTTAVRLRVHNTSAALAPRTRRSPSAIDGTRTADRSAKARLSPMEGHSPTTGLHAARHRSLTQPANASRDGCDLGF
jgi:hypothetical protein